MKKRFTEEQIIGFLCEAEAGLHVRKRRCKKIPLADRHQLERSTAANQVWSMDFVIDRTAEGRSIKSLTIAETQPMRR